MDWIETLKIHKGLDLFFNVSIPAAIARRKLLGHVLLICPDTEVRRYFSEGLLNVIQPLAVEKSKLLGEETQGISAEEDIKIGLRSVRWDLDTTCNDMAAALTTLQMRDVLLLNKERFELATECCDLLCSAMDTFALDVPVGHGPGGRSIRLDLPEFTFVVCVAEETEDIRTIASHFPYVIRISKTEVAEISEKAILLKAQEEGCSFSDDACEYIVRCADNDCMVALNYASRVIEYMRHYHSIGTQITREHASIVLGRLGVKQPSDQLQVKDDVAVLLRDIQKKLSVISAEVGAIKATLKDIRGDNPRSLTEISGTLDRIEESMH